MKRRIAQFVACPERPRRNFPLNAFQRGLYGLADYLRGVIPRFAVIVSAHDISALSSQ
jgi:hypothetical protein